MNFLMNFIGFCFVKKDFMYIYLHPIFDPTCIDLAVRCKDLSGIYFWVGMPMGAAQFVLLSLKLVCH